MRRVGGEPVGEPGDAEVRDFHTPFAGHQDVSRLHVPVHQLQQCPVGAGEVVRGFQASTGLGQHLEHRGERRRAPHLSARIQDLTHRQPVNVVHDHVKAGGVLTEVQDPHHAGVLDPSSDPRLVDQHLENVGVIAQKIRVDQLDRDFLAEAMRSFLDGVINRRHPPATDLAQKPVSPQVAVRHWMESTRAAAGDRVRSAR